MIARLLALALLAAPAAVQAQAYDCGVPRSIPTLRPELPSATEPARVLPIGGYTLAVTWAPEFCHGHGDDASARFECGAGNRFGFTLHGLWPDGVGKTWPQYCAATPLLTPSQVRPHLCATPSAQLMQHEWAKHGTCMAGYTPDRYFARSNALYRTLRFPDMTALSASRSATAGMVAAAIAKANPGIGPDMMRVTANRNGWLDEIWFCLDTRFRHVRCASHSGGVDADTPIKIARARR